jgi:hypothetical protein
MTGSAAGAARAGERAARSAPVRLAARVGLVAYGVVHLLVAWLAAQVALGDSAKADKTGALQTVAATALGEVLMWVITIGLGALVLWQLVEAGWGHHEVTGGRRTLRRVVSAGEALLYGVLAYSAWAIATGSKGPSDSAQSSLVARALAQPWGATVITLLGLCVVGAGAFLVYRGVTREFTRELDLRDASASLRRTVVRLGQIGWIALGVVYGTAGALVVVAAVNADPAQATGLDKALKTLAGQPAGGPLLLAVAAGLAAFGAYALLDARFRKA